MEQTKAPIFLEVVLPVEVMLEPQFNFKERVIPNILKEDFPSRTDPSIFTLIAPVLLDWSSETS